MACHWKKEKIIKLLLQYGANINHESTQLGLNPLACVLIKERLDLAKLLISKGAKVERTYELLI